MSLRINAAPLSRGNEENPIDPATRPQGTNDDWGSRVAKLIPAEALGFYGTAVGIVATWQPGTYSKPMTLIGITLVACIITIIVRFRATDTGNGPQIIAIAISLVSFLIWLAALATSEGGLSPFPREWVAPYAPLVALGWGTLVPYFYKGDAPAA